MSNGSERRNHPRRKINIPVKIKLKSVDDFVSRYVTDISAGGLFIATPTPYEPGDELDIEFYIEEDTKYFFKVRGVVSRLSDKPQGMGIQFTEIEESSEKLLEKLLTRMPA